METFGSLVVNGQNVPVIGPGIIAPAAGIGPMYSGPGQPPVATIPLATGGYATAGGVGAVAGSRSMIGPRGVVILVLMFAVGVIGLRYVHWRG